MTDEVRTRIPAVRAPVPGKEQRFQTLPGATIGFGTGFHRLIHREIRPRSGPLVDQRGRRRQHIPLLLEGVYRLGVSRHTSGWCWIRTTAYRGVRLTTHLAPP